MYYALIMAGGSGTRLWPLSRQNKPKQALKLIGERTMFQHAVDRLAPLFPPERVFVVTRAEHTPILMQQTPEIPGANFIVEPEGRGTAPAIGLAAIHLQQKDPDATMAVLTADHYISDTETFRKVLDAAGQVAGDGYLVTLGIKPDFPSTGFGYIEQGGGLGTAKGFPVFRVACFAEKPVLKDAQHYLESGKFSWNSGMFIWKVSRIMEEFEKQMPAFFTQLHQVAAVLGTPTYNETISQIWPQVAKETIDYGIMEGATRVAVLPASIGWTDVGSWASLFEMLPTDEDGNTWRAEHIAIDTHDSLVFGDKRLIATIGIEGLVIVDTEDALLVCTKEREQEVREIVKRLKESNGESWL